MLLHGTPLIFTNMPNTPLLVYSRMETTRIELPIFMSQYVVVFSDFCSEITENGNDE